MKPIRRQTGNKALRAAASNKPVMAVDETNAPVDLDMPPPQVDAQKMRRVIALPRDMVETLIVTFSNMSKKLHEVAEFSTTVANQADHMVHALQESIAEHDRMVDNMFPPAGQPDEAQLKAAVASGCEYANQWISDVELPRTNSPDPAGGLRSQIEAQADMRHFVGTASFFCRILSPAVAACGKGMVRPTNEGPYFFYENDLNHMPADTLLTDESWETGFYLAENGATQFLIRYPDVVIYHPNVADCEQEPIVIYRDQRGVPNRFYVSQLNELNRASVATRLFEMFPELKTLAEPAVETTKRPRRLGAGYAR